MAIDENELYKRLGAILKARRMEISISQGELARELKLERTSITNIEAGRQKAPLHLLYEICNFLGLDLIEQLPRYDDLPARSQKSSPLANAVIDEISSTASIVVKGELK